MSRWCSSGKAPLETTSWRPGPRYRHRRRAGEHGRLWGGHGEVATRRTGRGARRSGGELWGMRRRWKRRHGGGGRRVRPYPPRSRLLPVATHWLLSRDVFLAPSTFRWVFLRRGRQWTQYLHRVRCMHIGQNQITKIQNKMQILVHGLPRYLLYVKILTGL